MGLDPYMVLTIRSFERKLSERFNTNEYELNSHKGLTSLLTQNLPKP